MAGWFPTFQLLVAFNNTVFDDPALITTVASPAGTLGAANQWTDITPWVRDNVDTNRGRQHEIDRFQTGTLSCTLDNRDGRFDPWNTSSPYTGKVIPGRPVRLRATDPNTATVTALFTGLTDVWTTTWPEPRQSMVQLSCVDWFAYLTNVFPNSNWYTTTILADSPFAFWRLNDPAGSTTAADSSGGGGNLGVVFGTPTFGAVAGPAVADRATAVALGSPGRNHGYIRNQSAMINPVGANFTVEAWVQLATIPVSRSYAWCQPASGIFLWVDAGSGRPGWSWFGDWLGTTNICDNNWHHLVLTSTFTPSNVTLYVDGVAQNSQARGTDFTDTQLLIGSPNCEGNVANVALYNPALTAAQVATHYQAAGLFWIAEQSGQRVRRIAASVGAPTANATILEAGKSLLQAQAGSLATTAALSYLQTVEQTEQGALFIDGAGQIRFLSRDTIYSTQLTPTVTFGDNTAGGEIPYQPNPTIATDTLDQYTTVTVQRNGGNPQTATTGQPGKTLQQSGLLQSADTETAGMANWLLTQFSGTPKPRIRSITVHPYVTPTGTATTAILGLEPGAVVTVNRHTLPGAGTAFAQVANLEGINHHIYPATSDWNVELQLTPLAPNPRPWILGTSQLNIDTNLFF